MGKRGKCEGTIGKKNWITCQLQVLQLGFIPPPALVLRLCKATLSELRALSAGIGITELVPSMWSWPAPAQSVMAFSGDISDLTALFPQHTLHQAVSPSQPHSHNINPSQAASCSIHSVISPLPTPHLCILHTVLNAFLSYPGSPAFSSGSNQPNLSCAGSFQ